VPFSTTVSSIRKHTASIPRVWLASVQLFAYVFTPAIAVLTSINTSSGVRFRSGDGRDRSTKMVRYLNPGGFNFGPENLDGYGISNIVVGVIYSIVFYAACIFLWLYRRHPVVKMRNVPLLLLSLLILHVFAFMAMVVYTLNGAFPCQVEFWCMNLYLPIGIGLFQAQNQQLLIVSRQQAQLTVNTEHYRPLLPKSGRGIGGPRYWLWRLKLWWRSNSEEGKYQGYILVAIIVQVSIRTLTAVSEALMSWNVVHRLFHYL